MEVSHIKQILETTDQKPKNDKSLLFSHPLCPYAERARIAAALKKLDHQQVDIDLTKKPDWFFSLNPNGTVPTFETPDGRSLYESEIVVEALDDLHPEQGVKLLPEDKIDRGIMKCKAKLLTVFISVYHEIAYKGINEERAEKFHKELKKLNDELEGKKFLTGDNISYLDIMVYPHLERVLWFEDSVFQDAYELSKMSQLKNLKEFYERVREIKEVKPVLCVRKGHQLLMKRFKEEGNGNLVLPVVYD